MADGSSVYDRLGHGFTLVVLPGVDATSAYAVIAAADQHGIPVTVLRLDDHETGCTALELRDRWGADLLLIRPDQHVAWRGADWEQAASALRTAAGWPRLSDPSSGGADVRL